MSNFAKEMAFYTAYHQEKHNIAIHLLGIPSISFTAFMALHFLHLFDWQGLPITAGFALCAYASQYYLRTDLLFGTIATLFYGALAYFAYALTQNPEINSVAIILVGQIVGWGAQIWGHVKFEKNRPAFLQNLHQALISAPLFAVADVFFLLGAREGLQAEIHEELRQSGQLLEDRLARENQQDEQFA